jgi:hypothetical protein
VLQLCATNAKVQKKTLQLLAREDRKLQQERKFIESQGRTFQPTAVQEKNMNMWSDAKAQMPQAAAEAEAENAAPQRRERMTDIFRHQMDMQERLIQQYTQPSPLDAAMIHMLAQFAPPAVAPQFAPPAVAPQFAPPAVAPQFAPHASPQQLRTKKQRLEELQQLLVDGVISKEDCDQARMHILTHD